MSLVSSLQTKFASRNLERMGVWTHYLHAEIAFLASTAARLGKQFAKDDALDATLHTAMIQADLLMRPKVMSFAAGLQCSGDCPTAERFATRHAGLSEKN